MLTNGNSLGTKSPSVVWSNVPDIPGWFLPNQRELCYISWGKVNGKAWDAWTDSDTKTWLSVGDRNSQRIPDVAFLEWVERYLPNIRG